MRGSKVGTVPKLDGRKSGTVHPVRVAWPLASRVREDVSGIREGGMGRIRRAHGVPVAGD